MADAVSRAFRAWHAPQGAKEAEALAFWVTRHVVVGPRRRRLLAGALLAGGLTPCDPVLAASPLAASLPATTVSPMAWVPVALAVGLLLFAFHAWQNRRLARQEKSLEARVAEKIAALEQEREYLDALMDRVPEFIYFKDRAGRFLRVNRAHASAVAGAEPADLVGKTDFDYFPEPLARRMWEDEQRILSTGEPLVGLMEHVVRPGQEERHWMATKVPLHGPGGELVGIVGVTRDVTDRVQTEARMQELNTELTRRAAEATAANAELEAFAYSVSHDLRAPLRAIDGFSRILEREGGERLDAEGRRLLGLVRENAQQMAHLIDDLLSLSRIGRQELVRVDVDVTHLVTKAWETATRSEERIPALDLQPLGRLMGDPALLRQLFLNLLSNAVKFSRPTAAARVQVGCMRDGANVVYCVKDNGVGFDMRYSHKLFGVFQRLHGADEFEGTGVGLAIVQRVAHRHGGRAWAESPPGCGASFFVALPEKGESGTHAG
jgi:PAS domain S-box-containing protein